MSKVISNSQKQRILVSIPYAVTIGSTTYNATKIWSNQEQPTVTHTNPIISLNLSQDGIDTNIKEVSTSRLYYACTLTIHILGRSGACNGAHLCESIAQSINDTVSGWTTPLTDDIRIFDADKDITPVGFLGATQDVFDYTLSIKLYHS